MSFKYDYVILILFFLFAMIFSYIDVRVVDKELPLLGKVIFVDAGHGGRDPGALSGNVKEKDINLSIARFLADELLKQGAIPRLTRDGDYDLATAYAYNKKRSDLSARIKMIDEGNADMYLSIHLNSENDSLWSGSQVFYDDVNSENKVLAEVMQKVFKNKLYSKREVKEISQLYLYRNVKTLGVLLEVGFVSNAHDRYLLKKESYQQKLAKVITEGVITYYEEKEKI